VYGDYGGWDGVEANSTGNIVFSLEPATANPGNANKRDITWSIVEGNASAKISGKNIVINEKDRGLYKLLATVKDGIAPGTDYTQYFGLNFSLALGSYPIVGFYKWDYYNR
jgi:hypothetical protein